MKYRNSTYTKNGAIDCEINHPKFGWIPFTAVKGDSKTDDFFTEMEASGNVSEYVAPPVLPTPQSAPSTEQEIRKQRNQLLAVSDWTQVADAPVDQAAWKAYRQALRDVPQQEGFPEDVIWPTPPE